MSDIARDEWVAGVLGIDLAALRARNQRSGGASRPLSASPGDDAGYGPAPVDEAADSVPARESDRLPADGPRAARGAAGPAATGATAYAPLPSRARAGGYESLPVQDEEAGDSTPEPGQDAGYGPMPADAAEGERRNAPAASVTVAPAHKPAQQPGHATHYQPLRADDDRDGIAPRRKHESVEVLNSPIGLSARRVGAEYEGEHNAVAWRQWHLDPKDTRVTTRLQSDEEIAANRLVADEQGVFARADGSSVADKTLGYVMDPTTGTMVSFTPSCDVVQRADDGRTIRRPVGSPARARRALGRDPSARVEVTHHSSALGGEDVLDEQGRPVLDAEGRPMRRSKPAAAAGEVSFNALGQLIRITNASGHYKPTVGQLIQAVEQLARQGAFFTGEVVDAEGRPLTPGSDIARLYEAVQEKRATLPVLAARIEAETATLAGVTDGETRERSAAEIARATAEIAAINAAIDVLRRLGAGPSRKLRADAEVGLMERAEAMTGAEVRAETNVSNMSVDAFLRTGAGNAQQAQNKTRMHQELLAKRPKAPAASKAGPRAAPDAAEITAVLRALTQSAGAAPAAPRRRDDPDAEEIARVQDPPDQPAAKAEPERPRKRRLRNLPKQLAREMSGTFKAVAGGLRAGGRRQAGSTATRSKRRGS